MKTITIKTSGTHCPSCSMLIEMNVGDLPGVEKVHADQSKSTTEVTFDPAALDAEAIAEEIRKAGYGAEVVR